MSLLLLYEMSARYESRHSGLLTALLLLSESVVPALCPRLKYLNNRLIKYHYTSASDNCCNDAFK